jgi:hypothetical protein
MNDVPDIGIALWKNMKNLKFNCFSLSVYYRFFINEIYITCHYHFEFAPIQQLSRYHLVLMDILRELEKKEAPSKELKVVRQAEADMKKLMEKIYSMRDR